MYDKKLFLIDGNSYAYRAYYAIRELKNSKGFSTNAVYGFFNMLNRIISEEYPNYMAVAFDVKGPTFRHKEYEDYKVHRKPMPEDLVSQLPWIKEILKTLDIPTCETQGYEADDIIASLVNKFRKENIDIYVASNDKDLLQLVESNVMVYKYRNGNRVVLTPADVKQKYGIYPGQIPDFLALKGDKSDNIPGVPGVGKKYAVKLINEFGSVESIISNAESIKFTSLKKKIQKYKKNAVLSKKLTILKQNISFSLNLKKLVLDFENKDKLIPIFQKLEFNNLINKINSGAI